MRKYLEIISRIAEDIPAGKYHLTKIFSFILSLFIVIPFIILDINLIAIYYDLCVLLLVIFSILFSLLIIIYTKFYTDAFYGNEFINKDEAKRIIIVNSIIAFILGIIIFTISMIIRGEIA